MCLPSLRGALATKQSILSSWGDMDCFASLAMTDSSPSSNPATTSEIGGHDTPLATLFANAAFPIYRKRFMVRRALFTDEG
jgi:hypothetical protein